METMTNELTVIPRTIGMVTRMMDAVNIEDAVIVSEEEQKEHPNFIESNTSGITLEELEGTVLSLVLGITSLQSATRNLSTR